MNAFKHPDTKADRDAADPRRNPTPDYEEWCEVYCPLQNLYDPNAAFDGAMFETFGVELDHIASLSEHHVWTLIDEDGETAIVNGRHFVNRLGYFVTAIPWPDGLHIEVRLD